MKVFMATYFALAFTGLAAVQLGHANHTEILTWNDPPHFVGVMAGTADHAFGVGISHGNVIVFPAALDN